MFDQLYQFVIEQIGKNDLIAGGAVLGVFAYILNYLRAVPFLLLKWARLLFITKIDIPDRAPTFVWVSDWLSEHAYSKKAKRITVEGQGKKAKVTPAPGNHLIWWNKRPVIIKRVRREGSGDNAHRSFRESWSITMFGRRSHVEDFIECCRKVCQKELESHILVTESVSGCWGSCNRKKKRPIETVLLPEDMEELLVKDLNNFIDSKEWYEEMNIPWRRGYLLSGPPGNGKSSIIAAVASEIDYPIYIINLGQVEEEDLSALINSLPQKSILLLEDIDCAFEHREGRAEISMSTLLNLLDGVSATEGRLLFMTTNHPEKLDPALIRPGRVDLHLQLPNATKSQIEKLFARFFPDSDASEFANKLEVDTSMAKIQGYLLKYRNSPQDAMNNIKELVNA